MDTFFGFRQRKLRAKGINILKEVVKELQLDPSAYSELLFFELNEIYSTIRLIYEHLIN